MLDVVGDYVTEARRLLQDEYEPFRYGEDDFIAALNLALLEARRYRPDLFIGKLGAVPAYVSVTQAVAFSPIYRPAVLDYVVGYVGVRDAEASQDQRASGFLQMFVQKLTKAA